MQNKATLLNELQVAAIDPTGVLLIHSSMKALGEIEGGAETVINAFSEYMQNGLLIIPTHTWAPHCNSDNRYDPDTEPACTGILGELFRQCNGVVRSLHPTHSVAALGDDAEAFIAGEEQYDTPCPPNGVWGRLEQCDAQILFLGCPLSKNTFIHSIEEKFNIPLRLSKSFSQYQIKNGAEWISRPMRKHESPCGDISLNYAKLLPVFLQRGAAKQVTIGESISYLCSANQMAAICGEYLIDDPDFFAHANME
ncbi:AAC(3) family N-acetyltransferase [Psychromonas sp. MME2]|uniref:AAC(3) family N-acetyltransferase n=1 Tax=unclassified Psychromonas TaxID=2614957 RepID=UPI00339CBDD7